MKPGTIDKELRLRSPSSTAPLAEDDLLPISALQHLVFCERQCALIHIERVWADNPLTVEGKALHDAADEPGTESRRSLRIARSVPLRCRRLGVAGVADVIEFHRVAAAGGLESAGGVPLKGVRGLWQPFPVEYKRGKPKRHFADKVQLCAQAMSLEEMLGVEVQRGALFYGQTRRRLEIEFHQSLRRETERAAERLRSLLSSRMTPPAVYERKCKSCSLIELCHPKMTRSAVRYLERAIAAELNS